MRIRLLPRTLLWRAFLLVALLMVLSVLAWSAIYAAFEREPRARGQAQLIASIVNLTRAAILAADPELRRDLLQELKDREGIRLYPVEVDDRLTPPAAGSDVSAAQSHLRELLGPDTRVGVAVDDEPGIWVSFAIEGDGYWVVLPSERLARGVPRQWIGWGAAVLLLALAGAYLMVFRVARPLKALTHAAVEIGRARSPEPLRETGPLELRTVTRAFNQMGADLRQLDADRALILAGVSHDLRTPLARLRLGIEMSGADEVARTDMHGDIEEMDRIIGQFLDFAREDSGEAPQPADLAAIARDIGEQYARRGLPVSADAPAAPEIPLRVAAMRRLITNLIDNALRYAGEDKPVEVAVRGEADTLVLEVADRGPGIPAGEVERLKRPFTRLETARTDVKGSGLGLAIVERIARSHGGRLDLLARAGGGLVARVELPLSPAAAPSSIA